MGDYRELPADLPVPEDDGAADHLAGSGLPDVALRLAAGGYLNVRDLGEHAVVFVYPRTGTPGVESPDGWDQIPGARGCTPQSCAYRDRIADFERLGIEVFGLSSQPLEEQQEFQVREGIPYGLLNDSGFELGDALRLPTFEASGVRLYRRLTFAVDRNRISKVFYPVFPPDRNARDVLDWFTRRDRSGEE